MWSRSLDKLLKYDSFAETFAFKLPEGKDSFRTVKGCILTVLLILTCIFYGTMMSIKLQAFDETDVMYSVVDAFYDADFVQSDNLAFAFGLTAYDSNPDPVEDPSIGVVNAYYKSWGLDESIGGIKWELLPVRDCTEAELHINNQTDANSQFFKPHSNSERDLAFYYRKLKCIDTDKVSI